MEINTKDFQQIFEVAEFTAKKYYGYYKKIFVANNYDIDDLVQEAKVTVVETIKKYSTGRYKFIPKGQFKPSNNGIIYTDYNDIFKLSNQAIGWRLKNLLDECKCHLTVFEQESATPTRDLAFPITLNEETTSIEFPDNINFKFEELHIILTDKEYEVLYEFFHNKNTNEQIGKKYKCSKQRINKIYKEALLKVKNYLGLRSTTLDKKPK